MNFPLVPLPNWFLILGIDQEMHRMAALLGLILGLISGLGRLIPAVINGNKDEVNQHFAIAGLAFIAVAILFAIFGSIALVALLAIACVFGAIWFARHLRAMF